MFTEFRFVDFKSFKEATIRVKPLTLIIGANASGKSNTVDGLRLLRRMADTADLSMVLDGIRGQDPGIRGGSLAIPRKGANDRSFYLGCQLTTADGALDYGVQIDLEPRTIFYHEQLQSWKQGQDRWTMLLETGDASPERGDVQGNYYSGRQGRRPGVQFLRNYSALSQVPGRIPGEGRGPKMVREAAERISAALRKIIILDPVPHLMRDYQPKHRTEMVSTGENLSAVVAHLIQSKEMKAKLLSYLQDIPEQQIVDIGVLGADTGDVMLQLIEQCGDRSMPVDARSVSDGTLRFLAVVAALLNEEPGTTLVVEEIDNGLHPSRVGRLLTALREAGVQRGIQVIATTHNPALLNALTKDDLDGVVVCYRDGVTGESRFVPWLQVPSYPSLMARARLGDLVSSGVLANALHEDPDQTTKNALRWIKENLP